MVTPKNAESGRRPEIHGPPPGGPKPLGSPIGIVKNKCSTMGEYDCEGDTAIDLEPRNDQRLRTALDDSHTPDLAPGHAQGGGRAGLESLGGSRGIIG